MEFTYLRVLYTWWFRYSGLWHCVIGWVVGDVSEEPSFFFFGARYVPEVGAFDHWRWGQFVQSKRLEITRYTASYRRRSKFSQINLWEPQILRNWLELSWHPVKRRQMKRNKTAAWRKPSRLAPFRVCKRTAPCSVPLPCGRWHA